MTFWEGDKNKSPDSWAFDKSLVAPEWEWIWEHTPAFAFPLWGDSIDLSSNDLSTRGTLAGNAIWAPGAHGLSLDNTVDGSLDFPLGTLYAIPVADPEITIFTAFYLSSLVGANASPLAFRGSFGNGMWQIWKNATQIAFSFHNGSNRTLSFNVNSYPTTVGYHSIAIVRKLGGDFEAFVDGIPKGTGSTAESFTSASHVLTVGDLQSGLGHQVRGKHYTAIGWYNVAHNRARIKQLHEDPGGPFRMVENAEWLSVAAEVGLGPAEIITMLNRDKISPLRQM